MNSNLIANPKGGYRFLPGIEPYSSGVIAEPGWEIVHVTLAQHLPWKDGLSSIRRYLEEGGRDHHALCGVELRCPEPFSMDGFIAFNRQYRSLLEDWGMLVDGVNPIARTNVAPVEDAFRESIVYGFSYTTPSDAERPTFVVAGGGELRGALDAKNIVRIGETSEEAIMEKAQCVVEIMCERLSKLGSSEFVTHIDVYSAHNLTRQLVQEIIRGIPSAASVGLHWFYTRPPILDIEFEMDVRGVVREIVIDLVPQQQPKSK